MQSPEITASSGHNVTLSVEVRCRQGATLRKVGIRVNTNSVYDGSIQSYCYSTFILLH